MASVSFWVQLRLSSPVGCGYVGRGTREQPRAQTHPCKALTGQRVRIRGGFSSSVSPACLILHPLALPQKPQHRIAVASPRP